MSNNIFQVNKIKSSMWVDKQCIWSLNQEIRTHQDELRSLISDRQINPIGITLEHRVLNTPNLDEKTYNLASTIIKYKISNWL